MTNQQIEHGPHMIGRRFIVGKLARIYQVTRHIDGCSYADVKVHDDGRLEASCGVMWDSDCKWLPEHGEHNVGRVLVCHGNLRRVTAASSDGDESSGHWRYTLGGFRDGTTRWATPEEQNDYIARQTPMIDSVLNQYFNTTCPHDTEVWKWERSKETSTGFYAFESHDCRV